MVLINHDPQFFVNTIATFNQQNVQNFFIEPVDDAVFSYARAIDSLVSGEFFC